MVFTRESDVTEIIVPEEMRGSGSSITCTYSDPSGDSVQVQYSVTYGQDNREVRTTSSLARYVFEERAEEEEDQTCCYRICNVRDV